MNIFNFLKKKEFAEIDRLNQLVDSLNTHIASLNIHIESLSQYEKIVDIDNVIAEKIESFSREEIEISTRINLLKSSYDTSKKIFDDLHLQIELYNESLSLAEFGVYEPHFDFDASEQFKKAIEYIRLSQRIMIINDTAISSFGEFIFNGSAYLGEQLVKRQKKIMLRAFNGECDSFIASVDWNNIMKMNGRIHKSFDFINDIYKEQNIQLTFGYRDLKIKELDLTYEYKKKKHEEKEQQRAIKEQMREEEKAIREIESARVKAEKEEATYQKALDKAREEILGSDGAKQEKLKNKILELEARLKEAEENKERALSMAQQTKRGHVYVISNMGSLGENIYKIGMTRRLDPLDRVRELGDASVPFGFDVHAMIFTDNAPALELALHKAFEHKRVNLVNPRKEFFNVYINDIEQVVTENHGHIEFTKIAEAEEYRESEAIRNKKKHSLNDSVIDWIFPDKI